MTFSTQWYILVALLILVVARLLGQDLASLVRVMLPVLTALRQGVEPHLVDVVPPIDVVPPSVDVEFIN